MKKYTSKISVALLILCLSLSAVGFKKNEAKENKLMNTEEKACMKTGTSKENDNFKPSDYTLPVKSKYIYEFIGLEFKLSENLKKYILNKKIAMLDDQSALGKDLKYAVLTFSKMNYKQKNEVVKKMGNGYEKWNNSLERVGTIGLFKRNMSKKTISKITKCDEHRKIGYSSNGEYTYYLSYKKGTENDFIKEFNKTRINIIKMKKLPENGFVLSEKTDLENTEAFTRKTSNGKI